MENKVKGNNTLVAVLITLLICVTGFCVYLLVNGSNKVYEDKNGEVLNNTKVKGDLKETQTSTTTPATETTKEEVKEETKTNEDNSTNELVEKIKNLIFKTNAKFKGKEHSNVNSSLVDVNITKIDELYVNDKCSRYEIRAKYSCDNGNYDCVYFAQISDEIVKDANGYYEASFFYYNGDDVLTDSGMTVGPGSIIERKTIYEK